MSVNSISALQSNAAMGRRQLLEAELWIVTDTHLDTHKGDVVDSESCMYNDADIWSFYQIL